MAKKSEITGADRKAELISELAWSRAELMRDFHAAQNDFNVVARLKHSVGHHKTAWLTGATVFGWVLSRLPGRKKKQSAQKALPLANGIHGAERTAFWLALLGAILNFFKPVLTKLATHKLSELMAHGGGGWRKTVR